MKTQFTTFDTPKKVKGGWRQTVTTSAERILRINVYLWGADRLSLISEDYPRTAEASDGSSRIWHKPCRFDPPLLTYRLPPAVGDGWEVDGTCTFEDGRTERHRSTSRAVGEEKIDVAGRRYRCVVIEEEPEGLGNVPVSRCFSPMLGVTVRSESVQAGAHITSVLVSLPEKR